MNQTRLHMENIVYMKKLNTAFNYCISNSHYKNPTTKCQNDIRKLDIKNTYCDISKLVHVHLQYWNIFLKDIYF